jgi:hypothetical protein
MSFTQFPKLQGQWTLTLMRGVVYAGLVVLLVQIGMRFFLTGHWRQSVEESFLPCLIVTWLMMIICTIGSFRRSERPLGMVAALVGISSALIFILTDLLREGVYD